MLRVAGYLRVSTTEQAQSGLGLEAQSASIRAEAERRGWDLVEVIVDGGVSGRVQPTHRVGFIRIVEMLEGGIVDAVVVAKLDRLSRSIAHLAALADDFTRRGWGLVASDSPNLDTTSATGRLTFNLLGSVAEWERMVIGERTKAALAAKKARGERLGRPVSVPDSVRSRISRERSAGFTLQAIADGLTADRIPTARGGSWYPSTIKSVLRSIELDAEALGSAS